MFCIFYLWEHTQNLVHKIWYKNLWNWHGNKNLMIFDLWPHPKVTSLTLGWKFYLHSVLLVIPFDLIYHMTMFEKKIFGPLGTPSAPKSHPGGMTQGTEWKSRLICFVTFICRNTHKVWYKNLLNWLCNWNLMIFDLLTLSQGPRGAGQKKFLMLHAPFMSVTHTPNSVEFRPIVQEEIA